MKKVVVFLLLISLLSPLYALSFFYGAGGLGEVNASMHYTGFSLEAGLSFFEDPYLMMDVEIVLSPLFESVALSIASVPFSLLVENFIFSNAALYSPKIKLGGEYVLDHGWYYRIELAPVNFRDVRFEYEFFTPYMTIDAESYSLGYGIRLIRISYFF